MAEAWNYVMDLYIYTQLYTISLHEFVLAPSNLHKYGLKSAQKIFYWSCEKRSIVFFVSWWYCVLFNSVLKNLFFSPGALRDHPMQVSRRAAQENFRNYRRKVEILFFPTKRRTISFSSIGALAVNGKMGSANMASKLTYDCSLRSYGPPNTPSILFHSTIYMF